MIAWGQPGSDSAAGGRTQLLSQRAEVAVGPGTIAGNGMRLGLPTGWTGRIKIGGDLGGLPILQAGSFPLPTPDDDVGSVAERGLAPGAVYVNIIHYDTAPTRLDRSVQTTLPIRLQPAAFAQTYEGAIAPTHAREAAVVAGEYFVIDVSLGESHGPSAQLLGVANRVLSTFRPS